MSWHRVPRHRQRSWENPGNTSHYLEIVWEVDSPMPACLVGRGGRGHPGNWRARRHRSGTSGSRAAIPVFGARSLLPPSSRFMVAGIHLDRGDPRPDPSEWRSDGRPDWTAWTRWNGGTARSGGTSGFVWTAWTCWAARSGRCSRSAWPSRTYRRDWRTRTRRARRTDWATRERLSSGTPK